MKNLVRNSALALAIAGMAASVPAAANGKGHRSSFEQTYRDRYGYDTRYYGRSYHAQPDYRDFRSWRGTDGRYYCHRDDGTVGLVVGAAAGALFGHAIDGGYNHTLGTVIGGAIGALLGKNVAQGSTCH